MHLSINLDLIGKVSLALFLLASAMTYLFKWQISPKFFGVTALIAGVCLLLGLVVTTSYVVGRKDKPVASQQ